VSGFAVLAAKDVAVASGLGTSVLPTIAPSVIDGFAAGTLLSALCVLLVMAPRRGFRRRRARARSGARTTSPRNPMTPELSGDAAAASRRARFAAVAISDPLADESAEVVISLADRYEWAQLPGRANSGYATRHELPGSDVPQRRPEVRRGSGRHAAPSAGVGSRVASKLVPHALAARD
jgi:hypothetical protein